MYVILCNFIYLYLMGASGTCGTCTAVYVCTTTTYMSSNYCTRYLCTVVLRRVWVWVMWCRFIVKFFCFFHFFEGTQPSGTFYIKTCVPSSIFFALATTTAVVAISWIDVSVPTDLNNVMHSRTNTVSFASSESFSVPLALLLAALGDTGAPCNVPFCWISFKIIENRFKFGFCPKMKTFFWVLPLA